MCGRFTLTADRRAVAALLGPDNVPELFPRYNVAATQPVLAVRQGAERREAVTLRWGMIPSWLARRRPTRPPKTAPTPPKEDCHALRRLRLSADPPRRGHGVRPDVLSDG